MSAFVPVGVVFVLGMLQPNPSLRTAVFWQWANQSSNALINYANRNATADDPDGGRALRTMGESYAVAVAGACSITFGATRLLASKWAAAKLPAPALRGARLFVPLLSVCAANSFSLCVIRRQELLNGITVEDEDGRAIGSSKTAAYKAMGEMVLSRGIFLPSTVLGIPPVVMAAVGRVASPSPRVQAGIQATSCIGPWPPGPRAPVPLRMPVTWFRWPLCAARRKLLVWIASARAQGTRRSLTPRARAVALGAMLPLALACFPQRGSIAAAVRCHPLSVGCCCEGWLAQNSQVGPAV
jgi:hypothetical protein